MPNYWKFLARWALPVGVASLLSIALLKLTFALIAAPSKQKTVTLRSWDSPQNMGKQLITDNQQSARLVYEPLGPEWKNQTPASTQADAVKTNTQKPTKSSLQPTPAASKQKHLTSQKPKSTKSASQQTKSQQHRPLTIRVAITTNADSLTVGTSTKAVAVDEQGQLIGKIPAGEGVLAAPSGEAIQLGTWQAPASIWIKPTDGGVIYIADRWYRGVVRLIREGDRMIAVNYVDLEDYLYSVVGSEMPSYWPLEALKAQAVAARSYAIVHIIRPAHRYYDLGATPRWQAYQGLKAESNVSKTAVEATRGLFLSYQGGVVESLYAASDQIVMDAHGGSGMSQQGAYELSQQKYSYLHILAAYYPNTELAQIQQSQ